MEVYHGNIIFTPSLGEMTVLEAGYIVVQDGKIEYVGEQLPAQYEKEPKIDCGDKLIIPGFNDIHVHAPQWCNAGVGFSMELLPWLQTYTFPAESSFENLDFARREYCRFINELLKNGTTRAVMFASRHLEATKLLVELVSQSGMGAYVGKVNMDRNSIPQLQEETETSLEETRELIEWMANRSDNQVHCIITPRYVPCTTAALMEQLGELAAQYHLPVQSHLDENRDEVAWVKELHPERKSFADVYDYYGLMPENQTIMAHCIHMTEEEQELIKDKRVLVAHCAMSNADLSSGIMPLRKYLNQGIQVAIASDMGGSHSVKMQEHIVETIKVSKLRWVEHPEELAISFEEAFYLATKAGGSFFGKVGSFEVGYEFDALIINDDSLKTGIQHSLKERLERFVYLGDSNHIEKRIVSGKECRFLSVEETAIRGDVLKKLSN